MKWSGLLDRIDSIVLQAVFRKLSVFNHFVRLTLKGLRMDQSNLRKTACKIIKLIRSNKPDYFISSTWSILEYVNLNLIFWFIDERLKEFILSFLIIFVSTTEPTKAYCK